MEPVTRAATIPIYNHRNETGYHNGMPRRAVTSMFQASQGLMPKSFAGRPYTDSVLRRWRPNKDTKSSAVLHKEFMLAKKMKSGSALKDETSEIKHVRSESALETCNSEQEHTVDEENVDNHSDNKKDLDDHTAEAKTVDKKKTLHHWMMITRNMLTGKSKVEENSTKTKSSSNGVDSKKNGELQEKQLVVKKESQDKLNVEGKNSSSDSSLVENVSNESLTNEHIIMHKAQASDDSPEQKKTYVKIKRKISTSSIVVKQHPSSDNLVVLEQFEMQEAQQVDVNISKTQSTTKLKLSLRNSTLDESTVDHIPISEDENDMPPKAQQVTKKESQKRWNIKRKLSAHNADINLDWVSPEEQEQQIHIDRQYTDAVETKDDDIKQDQQDHITSTDSVKRKKVDPAEKLANRNWVTLRQNLQNSYTVREVFGQILAPNEKNPIIAIANVLLRDQRKFTMRTEWMTSAMIFNRFFIILLALAVVISILAVFLQSERISGGS